MNGDFLEYIKLKKKSIYEIRKLKQQHIINYTHKLLVGLILTKDVGITGKVIHKLKPVFVKDFINGWKQSRPLQWNWSACGLGELCTENGQSSYRWKDVTCKKCLKRKSRNLPTN